MFKTIMILDCNICGQPFNRVVTSASKDPFTWKSLSLELEDSAVNCGWTLCRSAHYCEHCVTHLDFESLSKKDLPEARLLQVHQPRITRQKED